MSRVIRFLGILPLLFLSGASTPGFEVPEADRISNWPAPLFWSPPPAKTAEGDRSGSAHALQAKANLTGPLPFIAVVPCRVVDTRGTNGTFGGPIFAASETRTYALSTNPACPGFPAASSIAGYSVNITVTQTAGTGFVTGYPSGTSLPMVSSVNFVGADQTISNAAIVPAGTGGNAGKIDVFASQQTHVIIDVNGYYDGSGPLQSSLARRAILDQFWTPQNNVVLGLTTVGAVPFLVRSDGADLWVASASGNSVSRVRASDGKVVETWTGAMGAFGVLVAMGKIFATGSTLPGQLYQIDPSQAAGAVTAVATNLGNNSAGIAFDGARIWTTNPDGSSVSIVTPGASLPWAVTNVTAGFTSPLGILYDGANIWVTDESAGTLLKLDGSGAVLRTVTVGTNPDFPIFDGANIWVPNHGSDSVSVVQASSGAVLATLTGNGLNFPISAAFDGQRVLITNGSGHSVSLWRTADLTPLGSFATGSNPFGACSDGINFWITLPGASKLVRF
jgi:hypothetical protein